MTAIRILHVDDEPDVRLLVEASLGLDPGLVTQSCASGAEALTIAAQWRPDLILLDATMPEMDGPATLAQLRDDPQTSGIPVIFLTASCQDSDLDRFKSIGSAGVIAKPFNPRALAASVRSHAQLQAADAAAAPVGHPALAAPAGATADGGILGHGIGASGNSMASGLSEATSSMPGDTGATVLFDANGQPLTLLPSDRWAAPHLHLGADTAGLSGAPAAFGGHDAFTLPSWSTGAMMHAAGAVTLLDGDASHGAGLPNQSDMPGATGSGHGGIGDHASGYQGASDLVHLASFDWTGGALAGGGAGSEIWGAGALGAILHDLKLFG